MAYKVLVVDDSSFYRRHLRKIFDEDPMLEVVGEATNGIEAIELIGSLSPDVVTMDVEMPVLDGISAVKRIMKATPVPILMFSSITQDGATATLEALEAGALDYHPKDFADISNNKIDALSLLRKKLRMVARRKPFMQKAVVNTPSPKSFMRSNNRLSGQQKLSENVSVTSVIASGKNYQCLAIGASTGGPIALQTILTSLPGNFPIPIVIIQHMPGTFTPAFAQRLNTLCAVNVIHAEQGMHLTANNVYIAPGGKQCLIEGRSENAKFTIRDTLDSDNVNYRPSVDLSLTSMASVFGGKILALILTGMGKDGKEGCEILKSRGATIWAQDQMSSVVYGMPQAVASSGIAEQSIGLENIANCLIEELV